MQIYKERQLCSGCSNCANKCPQQCIEMLPDDKGFLYPQVDSEKCINCHICQKVCPTYLDGGKNNTPKLFSYTSEKPEVLSNCSSGGAFGLIADRVLADNGYVCGAVWTSDFKVKHTVTNSYDDVKRMYGSKYLQSDLSNSFVIVKNLLEDNNNVLFSGTPCQVLALNKFLNKEYPNLITVDFICHSIPSPKVFDAYISSLEKHNGKLKAFNFRDKTNGWLDYSLKAEFENKTELYSHKGNVYMDLFLDGIIHRECCNKCVVKTTTGYVSDITLADFWGIKEINPQVYNKNGVSAILVNTEKGSNILQGINLIECDSQQFFKVNRAYDMPVIKSEKTQQFWDSFNKKGLDKAARQIYKKSFVIRLKTMIKNAINN